MEHYTITVTNEYKYYNIIINISQVIPELRARLEVGAGNNKRAKKM